ncbi:MAG: hypothetical protein A3C46_00595 [Deltaproteobacteria bacterium RIFCSPHIGHO2_02_FULL_44_16]|nr:MAG: hypothetical protein A3C46_00595 [Deltaproteobacteria bacterium RIFCSPHIGHO2_02_FULL_44_16]
MSAQPNDVIYEKDFCKDIYDLPKKIQDKLGLLIEILYENPFDSRLHTKHLGPPLQDTFSFRITRDYRVGFEFKSSHVIRLLAVDTRDKIYQRMLRKI